jgi:hypothetical protein
MFMEPTVIFTQRWLVCVSGSVPPFFTSALAPRREYRRCLLPCRSRQLHPAPVSLVPGFF